MVGPSPRGRGADVAVAHMKLPHSWTGLAKGCVRLRVQTWVAAGVVFMALANPALSAVLEIDPSGDVTVHDRPEVFLSEDGLARPIAVLSPRADISGGALSPTQSNIRASLAAEAERNHLSPALVEAVAWRESGLRQDAVSAKGAMGVMQLMPSTARALGVDPSRASENIRGGVAYLGQMMRRYDGDIVKSLAAYNASPGAVDRYGGPPPYRETQAYVAAILDRLAAASAAPSLQGALK